MLPATELFRLWAIGFVTLCVGLLLFSVYERLVDSVLGLKGILAEVGIAALASLVQAAELWFTASILGYGRLALSGVCLGVIYWLSHLDEWEGYEVAGVLVFQVVVWVLGSLLIAGMFKIAIMVFGVFILCLAVIASVVRSL